MSRKKDENRLDEIISRSINSGKPEFNAEKWKQKYPEEFQMLQSMSEGKTRTRRPSVWTVVSQSPITKLAAAVTAAAAAMIVVSIIWFSPPTPARAIGQVRNLYGIVALKNGGLSENVVKTADIHPGQWIETLSGSKAEVLMQDQSRLHPEPRTVFQINDKKYGQEILLQCGAIAVEAAKQPPGKSLTIRTDGSHIKVLGTRLDVRLVKKPDGTRQTRVSVASGSVELVSSGEKVLLLPNTEGIADEGKKPLRRSSNLEVNEMIRLFHKNNVLAAQSNIKAGLPVIVDFTGGSAATIWTLIPWEKFEETETGRYFLKLKIPAFDIKAFTLDGMTLEVGGKGNVLHIDLSDTLAKSARLTHVILSIPDIKGLFQAKEKDVFQFDRPATTSHVITLFQFRLPEGAYIHQVSPEIIEKEKNLNRLVVTIAANSQMPEICY